jgi:hypothetical protein
VIEGQEFNGREILAALTLFFFLLLMNIFLLVKKRKKKDNSKGKILSFPEGDQEVNFVAEDSQESKTFPEGCLSVNNVSLENELKRI